MEEVILPILKQLDCGVSSLKVYQYLTNYFANVWSREIPLSRYQQRLHKALSCRITRKDIDNAAAVI